MSSSKGTKGLKGQRCSNKNISMPALSKRDTFLISGLKVDPKHPSSSSVLRFFSEYPAMGVHPLLLEWHGSVMTIGDAR